MLNVVINDQFEHSPKLYLPGDLSRQHAVFNSVVYTRGTRA